MLLQHPSLAVVHRRTKSFSAGSGAKQRTSLDLELDLQASETRLQHLHDELERLKAIKVCMTQAKARGEYVSAAAKYFVSHLNFSWLWSWL